MTKEELEQLLGGDDLLRTLDIKTLVLDLMKDRPPEEFLDTFWGRLPELTPDYVRDYLYMRRS